MATLLRRRIPVYQDQHLYDLDPSRHATALHIPAICCLWFECSNDTHGIHRRIHPVRPFRSILDRPGEVHLGRRYHHSHIHLFSCQYFRGLDCGDNAGLHFVASPASQEVETSVFGYFRAGRPVSIPRVSITCSHLMVLTKIKTNSASIATIIRMPYVPGYAAKTDKLRKCRPLPISSLCCTLTHGAIAYRQDRLRHPLDSC